MNNQQYLSALKRALRALDRATRDDILREIQSHLDELGDDQTLSQRFGPPEQLAAQYLEDLPQSPRLSSKVAGLGKRVAVGVGLLVSSAIVIAIALVWFFSGDQFDYANETAEELELGSAEWSEAPWRNTLTLHVEQAHAVIYWHAQETVRWRCKGGHELSVSPSGEMQIRHASCLLFVPTTTVQFDVRQSGVVLVRPQSAARLTLSQANLRIAENGTRYRYDLDCSRSDVATLQSHADAQLTISIKATESSIALYEY